MDPPQLVEHENPEHVIICKETLKLFNDSGHCFILKFITDDEKCIPCFFFVPTCQGIKAWLLEYNLKPTIVKIQRAMKKINNYCNGTVAEILAYLSFVEKHSFRKIGLFYSIYF